MGCVALKKRHHLVRTKLSGLDTRGPRRPYGSFVGQEPLKEAAVTFEPQTFRTVILHCRTRASGQQQL